MYAALSEAELALVNDEIPIGSVVVYEDKIIGRGHNQVERLNDSTAHAEIIALTSASNHLKNKMLTNCEIYVTIEPCLMCAGAILLSKVDKVFIGTMEPKFGACGSLYNVLEDGKYNHKPQVYSGIYENEAANLMMDFFKKKRKK